MIRKGNFIKCERCSDKAGKPVFFFSRKWGEHHAKPTQCPKCKRIDWEKVRVK